MTPAVVRRAKDEDGWLVLIDQCLEQIKIVGQSVQELHGEMARIQTRLALLEMRAKLDSGKWRAFWVILSGVITAVAATAITKYFG